MNQFLQVEVNHVLRFENDKAEAIANLGASLILLDEREVQLTIGECHLLVSALDHFEQTEETNMVWVFAAEEKQIGDNFSLKYDILPTNSKKRVDGERHELRVMLKMTLCIKEISIGRYIDASQDRRQYTS